MVELIIFTLKVAKMARFEGLSKTNIDMSNFSKCIPRDLAKELLDLGMPLFSDVGSYYKCPIDYDTKDVPSIAYKMRIPTYGEVIDWFSGWGIYITFDVFFTFSLADNVAYIWKISYIKETYDDIRLEEICEEEICNDREGCGGSFELVANAAIRYAMKLKKNI